MKVCNTEVFGPMVGVASYDDFEDALALGQRHPLRAAGRRVHLDLGKALRAGDVLDFGGVIVNEVPTWRADQMPYGGVRDSGNTREGPAYTVAGDDRAPPRRPPGLTAHRPPAWFIRREG